MKEPIVLIGAGGHARVVLDLLKITGREVLGFVDPKYKRAEKYLEVACLGSDEDLLALNPDEIRLANGVGSVPGHTVRVVVYERIRQLGFEFASLIHPSSVTAQDAEFSPGVQIMAGAVVQSGCKLGENVLVNTRASIDHDCFIGDHSHVAPGATLSGDVHVGKHCHVGTGASIIQGISIANNCVIGAGAIVTKDVPQGHVVYPARSTIREGK